MVKYQSHGTGKFKGSDFAKLGKKVIFEPGVLVFHPENIEIGDNVYVGHNAILKGYYKNKMVIGSGTWIGQGCFFHSPAGLEIGKNVGIGPGVKIITSQHGQGSIDKPIIFSKIILEKVVIGEGSDIGVNACIMPGVKIGKGVQIGAGAVVTHDVPDYEIWAGVPAKFLKKRLKKKNDIKKR